MLFASGMAATVAPFQALKPGDHAVAPTEIYWGMKQWLMDFGRASGLEIDFVDMTDLAALAAAVQPGRTKLIWIETPANPTWTITDIAAAGGDRAQGRRPARRRQYGADAGAHPAARAGCRSGHACGDQISERP